MSKYTTGEMAKLCGITVRAVQYYDTRNILVPSELSEGGRRLYSDDDLQKLKIICFLRELGIPISGIEKLLSEEDPSGVIILLLEQQERELRDELAEKTGKLERLAQLKRELAGVEHITVKSIGDIAYQMEHKKKMRRLRIFLIVVGIIMDAIEVGTAILWYKTGIWWPFAIGMCIVVALGIWISAVYFRRTAYICPQCHEVFKPTFKAAFFAPHTPRTRKLTCPKCGHRGYCVETWAEDEKSK